MGKLSAVVRIVWLGTFLSFTQCKRDKPSWPSENLSWNMFLAKSVTSLKYIKPRWASAAGENQYDSLVQIPCLGQRNRDQQLCYFIQEKANRWPATKLSAAQHRQQALLLDVIQKIVFELEINKSHEHDPVLWEIPETMNTCLDRNQLPLAQRLLRMERLTEIFLLYLEKRELDLIHIDSTAMLTAQLCIAVSRQILLIRLPDVLQKSNLPPADYSRVNQKAAALANRLSEYEIFLLSQYPSSCLSTARKLVTENDIELFIPQRENEGRKSFSALIHAMN